MKRHMWQKDGIMMLIKKSLTMNMINYEWSTFLTRWWLQISRVMLIQ